MGSLPCREQIGTWEEAASSLVTGEDTCGGPRTIYEVLPGKSCISSWHRGPALCEALSPLKSVFKGSLGSRGGGDSQAVLSPSQAHEHHLNTQLWQARGRPTHGLHLQVVSSVSENAIDTWKVSVQGPGIPACAIQSCETQEALFPLSVFSTTNPGSELS